jgi:hypothetical protein
MPEDRPRPTPADYVALALSPALIIALVGSLVFFLLEVLYQGDYTGRLQWILFFFVFGAVLIARISMMADIGGRASLYGLALGFLVWLGMQFFVDYPEGSAAAGLNWLINLALIGLVWWGAHRLTWDCTQEDEETDVTGEGILQAAGLETVENPTRPDEPEEKQTGEQGQPAKREGWLKRYQRYREERKKRRPLGVWIIYFSLAALPIFGLGQSLIPTEDTARRRYTFWLMSIYVASGLGLLLTTCFLTLRRYLRQRRLRMPAAMTGVWLTVGGSLIVVLLLVGAFLPRPEAEYPLIGLGRAKSHKRSASRFAFKGDSPGKNEGRGAKDAPADQQPAQSGRDGKKDAQGQGASRQGKGDGQGQGDTQGKDGSSSNNSRQGKEGSNQPGKGHQKNASSKSGGRQAKDDSSSSSQESRDPSEQQDEDRQEGSSTSSSRETLSRVGEVVQKLAPVLKWVVFALVALGVLFFVLRGALQFLANFTDWARRLLDALSNFWASLFGGRKKEKTEEAEEEAPERAAPPRPFSSYSNPFTDGSRRSTAELVRYTFAAVQAWARERSLERQPGETPLEFAGRIGEEVPALEADLRRLANLYARAAYGPGGLPPNTADVLRQFWERLVTVAEQPLSA